MSETFAAFEQLTADELLARGSSKWTTHPGTIGSFIAESDFGTAPAVTRVLQERVAHGTLGYSTKREKELVAESLSRWLQHRHGWEVPAEQIGVLPEVLTALEITLDHYTEPGTPVVVPTPNYMPFFTLLRDHGREVVETPLLQRDDTWEFDYQRIDDAFAAGARLLVLVNPANPTGTVFTREQLLPLVDIVERHGGRVWADEIHAPIIYDEREHVPYATLSPEAAAHTITATSASKGWNIPGIKCSQIIFSNPADAKAWPQIGRWPSHTTGHLGVLGTIAAFDEGRDWLDDLVAHLQGHRDRFARLAAEHLPLARLVPAQATYLGWLDLRAYEVRESLQRLLLRDANVAATDGRHCGRDFRGFLRLNFATPGAILDDTFARIAAALPAGPTPR
ncbi:MalY/PatB family protein [Leucobacter japonicus]|uniref:MalY/PatB family protein n=1 Tax=Leucobacter japonicus TaxID=1461259 RepID=UPI0006A7D205|nr:aminotransferase class I/II-fold pyridoxal phosphate-dependent enzyme [Leucobacter japonicus]